MSDLNITAAHAIIRETLKSCSFEKRRMLGIFRSPKRVIGSIVEKKEYLTNLCIWDRGIATCFSPSCSSCGTKILVASLTWPRYWIGTSDSFLLEFTRRLSLWVLLDLGLSLSSYENKSQKYFKNDEPFFLPLAPPFFLPFFLPFGADFFFGLG